MKRIYVNLTDEQAAALKQRAVETGVLQVEQIRRAINLSLFADSQQEREQSRPKTAAVLVAQR
jgi:hypothetical protein